MRPSDLARLYDYNYWANERLLAVIAELTPEEFTRSVAGSYGSIRNTMVHVLSAEWGWLDRCGGPPRGEKLKPEDYATLAPVVDAWQRVERHMRGFLAKSTEKNLARRVEFKLGDGPTHSIPAGDLLQHAALHAQHHRGQIALLLRELGRSPGNVDFLFYAERA